MDFLLCTLAEAKASLRIRANDADADVTEANRRASALIENHLRRNLIYRGGVPVLGALQPYVDGPLTIPEAHGPCYVRARSYGVTNGSGRISVTGTDWQGGAVDRLFQIPQGDNVLLSQTLMTTLFVAVVDMNNPSGQVAIDLIPPYVDTYQMTGDKEAIYSMDRPIIKHLGVTLSGTPVEADVVPELGMLTRKFTANMFGPDFPEDFYFRYGQGGSRTLAGGRVREGRQMSIPLWPCGNNIISHEYVGGYLSSDDLPAHIKQAHLSLLAMIYRSEESKDQNVTTRGDGAGSYTRYSQIRITPEIDEMLSSDKRYSGDVYRVTV